MASRFSRIARTTDRRRTIRDYALLTLIPLCMVTGCSVASTMDAPANVAPSAAG